MYNADLNAIRICSPEDVRGAAASLSQIVEDRMRLRTSICHNIAVNEPMIDVNGDILATSVFGWTSDSRDRWWRTPRLALKSPITTACRYENEPFWCNAQGFRTVLPNPQLEQLNLDDFLRRSLTPAAIVVPVHLPFGQIGAAGYLPIDRETTDLSSYFEEYGTYLGLLSHHFITGYVRAMGRRARLPVGAILSKREVECLKWAAVGKTDYEISLIIGRSRATIRFHINNACTKLNAVNKSQALLKAAQLGYIICR